MSAEWRCAAWVRRGSSLTGGAAPYQLGPHHAPARRCWFTAVSTEVAGSPGSKLRVSLALGAQDAKTARSSTATATVGKLSAPLAFTVGSLQVWRARRDTRVHRLGGYSQCQLWP